MTKEAYKPITQQFYATAVSHHDGAFIICAESGPLLAMVCEDLGLGRFDPSKFKRITMHPVREGEGKK